MHTARGHDTRGVRRAVSTRHDEDGVREVRAGGAGDEILSCVRGGGERRAALLPAVWSEFVGDTAADAAGQSGPGHDILSADAPVGPSMPLTPSRTVFTRAHG